VLDTVWELSNTSVTNDSVTGITLDNAGSGTEHGVGLRTSGTNSGSEVETSPGGTGSTNGSTGTDSTSGSTSGTLGGSGGGGIEEVSSLTSKNLSWGITSGGGSVTSNTSTVGTWVEETWVTDGTSSSGGIALKTVGQSGGASGTDWWGVHVETKRALSTGSGTSSGGESTSGTVGGTSSTSIGLDSESGWTDNTTDGLTRKIGTIGGTTGTQGVGDTVGGGTIGLLGLRLITSQSFVGGGNSEISEETLWTTPRSGTRGTIGSTRNTRVIGPIRSNWTSSIRAGSSSGGRYIGSSQNNGQQDAKND